jgi:polysaccharide biosynthesis/export protein
MRKLMTIFSILGALVLSCPAQTESLLIGPGDMVYVEVFDTPEMAQEVRVTDAGTVPLAFIGDVRLAGETPATAAKLIEKALIDKKLMLHPQVKVKVEEYATQDVSVLGQVQSPGTFPITTSQSLLKILSLAGGLTSIADRNITIERHDPKLPKATYYLANNAEQALSTRVLVYPGDTVIVPRAPIVYVLGDVAKPGGYAITTNDSHMTILQAIAMAGSANKTAVQSRVRLIRKTTQGQEELPIQLAAIQKGKLPDMVLQSDDVLYVPFSWMRNMAMTSSGIAASTSSAAIYAIK